MRVLDSRDCLTEFVCPACRYERLRAQENTVACEACGRAFPVHRGVIDYVIADELDATGAREHVANAIELDSGKAVRRKLRKAKNTSPMLLAQMRRSIRAVDRLMAAYGPDRTLVSLGSGFGFELPLLLERRAFARVLSSDIAWSATALVPEVTERCHGELVLFASEFGHVPLARRDDRIGFVFLALHHAEDPHRALAGLLDRNFDHLVIVEPLDNWLVEIFARLGLARRVEYSGTRPQWLDPRRLGAIAREHGFDVRIETWWEIPRDRLPRRMRKSRFAWRPLFVAVEGVSWMLRPLAFGSMGVIAFRRQDPGRAAT